MGIELNERFILKESGGTNVYLSKMFRLFRWSVWVIWTFNIVWSG